MQCEGCIYGMVVKGNQERGRCFKSSTYFVVSDERRIKIQKDGWCTDSTFNLSFPSLYALTISKGLWVVDVQGNQVKGAIRVLVFQDRKPKRVAVFLF